MDRRTHNESIDHSFNLPLQPQRIVSLVSSVTEAMDRMGMMDRVAGVSAYCHRYLDTSPPPVVGDYLTCRLDRIREINPDLILTTTGIQRKLAQKLAGAGFPVYSIPLPLSFHGILENVLILGRLLNAMDNARDLVNRMQLEADALRSRASAKRPEVYLELWLGKHMRAVGGASFICDLIDLAGGNLIFKDRSTDYFTPDFDEIRQLDPDLHLFFHEPEYQIESTRLVRERGWDQDKPILISTVERGRNMIQDGPSFLESATWLQKELQTLF